MNKSRPLIIKKRQNAQAMVEFALVIGILLVLVYGMLEVGRLLFVYSTIISAAREAVRYGSATGLVSGASQYKDCTGIRAAAQKVDFLNAIDDTDIVISYDHGPGTAIFTTCPPTMALVSGDRVIVQVSGTFTPVSAFIPLNPMTIQSSSMRTILGKVEVSGVMPPAPVGPNVLSVSKDGVGTGTVMSMPGGINCGSTCTYAVANNTIMTLNAYADVGSTFTGWSGACSGTGACTLTMNSTKSVTATFDSASKTLTVSKAGIGNGTVLSDPTGIECGANCSHVFDNNAVVMLSANADGTSTFTGWSGACTGTGLCTVTMDAAKSVTATFDSNLVKTLSVLKAGAGSGTVTSNPAGINCGATCSNAFDTDTDVTLTATPDAGSIFIGWSGACSGTGTCDVTMDAAKSVTATFDSSTKILSVSKTGLGAGTVTSNPVGISCGATCSTSFANNTSVTLTASADTGSTFTGWSGVCSGTGTCTVTLDATKLVIANFDSTTVKTLSVLKAGSGAGTVTSTDIYINCGTACEHSYNNNTVVTLSASPNASSTFAGWSGACSGTGTCTVTMDAAKTVTASFTLLPTCTFTTSVPVYQTSAKTITWEVHNTSGSSPTIASMIVFWDGGGLQSITIDTLYFFGPVTPALAPNTYNFPGNGKVLIPGNHTIIFSFPAPTTIRGYNFSATISFVETNCPMPTTGSWRVP